MVEYCYLATPNTDTLCLLIPRDVIDLPKMSVEIRRPDGLLRLLLVDDHTVVRIGLKTLFSRVPTIQVVGEAGSVAEAVAQAAHLKPHVIVMDIQLPDGTGIDACRDIRADFPDTRVLFLSAYANEEATLSAILAGADGFLLKQADEEGLIRAVERVGKGESILDPAVTRSVLARLQAVATQADSPPADPLSAQERRVLALVAEGKVNKEIAITLNLSDKTVKNYLSHIFQKLHVTRRSQAAVLYASHYVNRAKQP